PAADPWFEVYRVAPGVFAIYEPHQFEEVISFLILGEKRAALFDTGLGIGDIQRVVAAEKSYRARNRPRVSSQTAGTGPELQDLRPAGRLGGHIGRGTGLGSVPKRRERDPSYRVCRP